MYQWTDEQEMVRGAVRQFIDKEIRPRIDEFEHGDTPPYDVLRKMFREFGMDVAARDRFAKQMEFEKAVAAVVAERQQVGRASRRLRASTVGGPARNLSVGKSNDPRNQDTQPNHHTANQSAHGYSPAWLVKRN